MIDNEQVIKTIADIRAIIEIQIKEILYQISKLNVILCSVLPCFLILSSEIQAACSLKDSIFKDQKGEVARISNVKECFGWYNRDDETLSADGTCNLAKDAEQKIKEQSKNYDVRFVGQRIFYLEYKNHTYVINELAVIGVPWLQYSVHELADIVDVSHFKSNEDGETLISDNNILDFTIESVSTENEAKELYRNLIGLKFIQEKCRDDNQKKLQEAYDAYNTGDFVTALRLWKILAENGDKRAQNNLASLYYKGQGTERDYKMAIKWYILAAEQGFSQAQLSLATMYEQGQGIPQDYKLALKWYTLAAKQGNADAQMNLGLMYDNGNGTAADFKEAAKWYTLASEQGHVLAQNMLGLMYEYGHGVQLDYIKAHMWYNIAATDGTNKKAITSRNSISKKMTNQQISKAQENASKCIQSQYKNCN